MNKKKQKVEFNFNLRWKGGKEGEERGRGNKRLYETEISI